MELVMKKSTILLLLLCISMAAAQKNKLELETAVSRKFLPDYTYNIDWRNNDIPTWISSKVPFALLSYTNELVDTLARINDLNALANKAGMDSVSLFPRGKWLNKNEYFFSGPKAFWKWNIQKKELQLLAKKDPEAEEITVDFSHDAFAFVKDQNLYVSDFKGTSRQITTDGGGDISYGIAVHQREFGIENGIFWSPKARFIAFYREDKSAVTKYPYVDYTTRPAASVPEMYPMAGMKNTSVSVWIYDRNDDRKYQVETGEPDDQYLTNITWSPEEEELFIAHVNRDQNHMRLISYDAEDGKKEDSLFEEKSEKYVEPEHGPVFIDDDDFLWFSKKGGWNHLYIYDDEGVLQKRLTKGEWEVQEVIGFDQEKENVYLLTTKDSPLDRTVYKVNLESGKMHRVSGKEGWYRVTLNPKGNAWIENFNSMLNPGKLDIVRNSGKSHRVLSHSNDPSKNYEMPSIKIGKIKAADGKTDLYTRLLFPPDFSADKKYPVLVYVYGGPHAQLIVNRWFAGARGWLHYMAASGYIVFTVDSRGSGNRGLAFEQSTFRQLSKVEIEDQLEGVKYLKSLPYVDENRIGLHGWSYGGYMTVSLMLRSNDVFKVAIAGAPVIDWRYYETVYTERYMDTPEANPEGYEMANTLNYVNNLNGRLMIIHGTSDHIVMWQNSILFVDKCIKSMKLLDYMIYPGHDHGVRGKDRVHLYKKMTRYFDDFLR